MIALLFALSAHADAIMEPPTSCPWGAHPQSTHEGTWCEASECAGGQGCWEGESCHSDVGLCVDVVTGPCGGRRPDQDAPCTVTHHEALGSCRTDADCARGACIVTSRCAEASMLPSLGCAGCATAPSGAALLGLALLAVLIPRGRRRD